MPFAIPYSPSVPAVVSAVRRLRWRGRTSAAEHPSCSSSDVVPDSCAIHSAGEQTYGQQRCSATPPVPQTFPALVTATGLTIRQMPKLSTCAYFAPCRPRISVYVDQLGQRGTLDTSRLSTMDPSDVMEVGMPQERLSMRKAREILRLRLGLGLSAREVARSCKVSHTTVLEYERRARSAGLGWPLPEGVDDAQLETIVCGPPEPRCAKREMPDIGYLGAEMKKRHVTLSFLWLEYKAANPDGYQYTQFCEHYKREKKKLDVVLSIGRVRSCSPTTRATPLTSSTPQLAR